MNTAHFITSARSSLHSRIETDQSSKHVKVVGTDPFCNSYVCWYTWQIQRYPNFSIHIFNETVEGRVKVFELFETKRSRHTAVLLQCVNYRFQMCIIFKCEVILMVKYGLTFLTYTYSCCPSYWKPLGNETSITINLSTEQNTIDPFPIRRATSVPLGKGT